MEKNNLQLIEDVKGRLLWYTMEASEEEFNEEEVEALLRLLEVLEGGPENADEDTKEALERFWGFRDKRLAEEGGRAPKAVLSENMLSDVNRKRNAGAFLRRCLTAAAMIAIVFFIFAGGMSGSIAFKSDGFFQWLSRDKSGISFITAPEKLDVTANTVKSEEYAPDQVPQEYRTDMVEGDMLEALEGLKGFELKTVELLRSEDIDSVMSFLENKETGEEMTIDITIYSPQIFNIRITFEDKEPGYIHEYHEEKDGFEYDFFSKPNEAGGNDYLIFFFHGFRKYTLSNRDDSAKLLEVAEQLYKYING